MSSGHHLLDHNEGGGLVVTDEFLKLFLARPELLPPPEACPVELGVHAQLLAAPRLPIAAEEIALIQDSDARENWTLFLTFRDHLLAHQTLEGAYVDLIRKGVGRIPPLFIAQLTQVILRNALDGEGDAQLLRAAELFFRPQRMSVHEGAILLADDEVIAGHEATRAASPLIRMFGGEPVAELDVLTAERERDYPHRSDAFDFALDFRRDGPGRRALGVVIERWVRHLLGVEAAVASLDRLDGDWRWYVGLDQDGTRIGDALWTGKHAHQEDLDRILAIYRMEFRNPSDVAPSVRGKPAYLILGMSPDGLVRLKPQNLIVGLPLAIAAHA